jgi:hypothetical protein
VAGRGHSFNALDTGQAGAPMARLALSTDFFQSAGMTALNLTNQLLNFMAPAAFVALFMVLVARAFAGFLRSKKPLALSLTTQRAIVFVASLTLLVAGLVIFGRDGKMASYALLAVGAATCQWVLLRGWKA